MSGDIYFAFRLKNGTHQNRPYFASAFQWIDKIPLDCSYDFSLKHDDPLNRTLLLTVAEGNLIFVGRFRKPGKVNPNLYINKIVTLPKLYYY